MQKYFFVFLFINILFIPCSKAQTKPEFRGVWVATVDNIDWPTKGNFNTEAQKAEFIKLLDMHERNGINALVIPFAV